MKVIHLLLLACLALLPVACSSDDESAAPGPINAQSVMGTYNVNGTWETPCYTTDPGGGVGNTDLVETRVVSDRSMTGTTTIYGSADGSCTLGSAVDPQFTLVITFSSETTFSVLGWSNGANIVAAPNDVSGSPLPANPTATLVDASGTYGGNPVSGKLVIYIDDSQTGTDVIWYRSTNNPQATCDPPNTGTEQCLMALDELHKL